MSLTKKTRLIGKERLLDVMAARAFGYAFLARAFMEEATADYLAVLVEEGVAESFPSVEQNDILKQGHEELLFFLRDPDLLTGLSCDDLASDYSRLFIVSGKSMAQPYESMYLSSQDRLFQEHTMQVRAVYARNGYKAKNFQQEPDDHIGLELSFLGKLVEDTLPTMRSGHFNKAKRLVREQKSFLDEHLGLWVRRFAQKVIDGAQTPFYSGLAKMLIGYVEIEKNLVDELIDELGARIKDEKESRKLKRVE